MADNLLDRASILLTPTAYDNGSMLSIKPKNGDGDFTFSRAGNASRVNSSGNIVTESANIPRIDYTDGCGVWLLELQSMNLYLNSETLSTQSNATSASTYTVSFYGTGTITFSGTHTGTLVGTAADERVSATFTTTSGTLTSTISGTCTKGQLENLSYATSYITTNGSIATRLADQTVGSGNSSLINSTEGVLYVQIAALAETNDNIQFLSLGSGSYTNNSIYLQLRSTPNQFAVWAYSNNLNQLADTFTVTDITDYNKIAISYKLNDFKVYVNGSIVYTNTTYNQPAANSLNVLEFARDAASPFYGKAKAVAVYKEALTDAELIELTTI